MLIILLGILTFFSSCNDGDEVEVTKPDLELLVSYKTNVSEPSGLAINSDGTILYTVSDNTGKIYKLSTTGNLLQTFNYVGNDLEGVSIKSSDILLLAEERTKEIVEYYLSTGSSTKHKVNYENTDDNNGIEGVAFNTIDNTIFMLNEKNPGLLMRLRADFSIISTSELNFAGDYSGIFHDSFSNNLWIISDQSKTLNKCSLTGKLIKSYSINISKAEGVAVTSDKVYIISDSDAKLYVYKKPTE